MQKTYEIKPVEFTRPDNWQELNDSLASYEASIEALSTEQRIERVRSNLGLHGSTELRSIP